MITLLAILGALAGIAYWLVGMGKQVAGADAATIDARKKEQDADALVRYADERARIANEAEAAKKRLSEESAAALAADVQRMLCDRDASGAKTTETDPPAGDGGGGHGA